MNYFETTVKFEKTVEEGKILKVSEKYLVDALSFTGAEARIIEEMKPFISGEFQVSKITRAKINELFANENGDKWYKCKVFFVSLDEVKVVEKLTSSTMYAQANDTVDAERVLREGMKGSMADYVIASITETKILDVFNYKVE